MIGSYFGFYCGRGEAGFFWNDFSFEGGFL